MASLGRAQLRGVRRNQEIDPASIVRDIRTTSMKFADFMSVPLHVAGILFMMAIINVMFPVLVEVVFILSYLLYRHGRYHAHNFVLPLRMPQTSGLMDHTDLDPAKKKPQRARGIFYLGREKITGRELWATNDDMRTHLLVMGTTGAGKTATLSSMTQNCLIQCSGYIYVDGKADNSLWVRLWAMARQRGRDDDMLLISFMTGAKDIIGKQERLISNTMNTCTFGSSKMIAQNLVSLLDDGGSSGDMWKGRAINFIEALSRALVHMRDYYNMPLSIDTYRQYFELADLEEFCWNARKTYNMPPEELVAFKPLENYLVNLPGYKRNAIGKQEESALTQHGFITMQLVRSTGSLADTYGHVVNTLYGEVDFFDVVINRRLLMIALPALENSPDELANLGKINISNLKATLAATLGADVEGTFEDIILKKPTTSNRPFVSIFDEYGYYAVKGFAVVAAQARSLGFSAIFAGQDYPAFKKAGEEEAASIIGNCNIKMCMKLEDPSATFELFKETAGESYVTNSSGFSSQGGGISNSYTDMMNASIEKRYRIELTDLKDQMESEAHFFFKSSIIRGDTFYSYVPDPKIVRLNSFVVVPYPTKAEIEAHLDDPEERLVEIDNLITLFKAPLKKPLKSSKAWRVAEMLAAKAKSNFGSDSEAVLFDCMLVDGILSGRIKPKQKSSGPRVSTLPPEVTGEKHTTKPASTAGNGAEEVSVSADEYVDMLVSEGFVSQAFSDFDPDVYEPIKINEAALDMEQTKEQLAQIEVLTAEDNLTDEEAFTKAEKVVADMGNGVTYSRRPNIKNRNQRSASVLSNIIDNLSDLLEESAGEGDN